MRIGSVSRLPYKPDLERSAGRVHGPRHYLANPRRNVRGYVKGEHVFDLRVFHKAGLYHALGSAYGLLRGLKEELYAHRKLAHGFENLGGSKQYGRMDVVTAGVHDAGHARFEFTFGELVYRQSVHVGAHPEGTARVFSRYISHHAVAGNIVVMLYSEPLERFRNEGRSHYLLLSELGVHVYLSSNGDCLFKDRVHHFLQLNYIVFHFSLPEDTRKPYRYDNKPTAGFLQVSLLSFIAEITYPELPRKPLAE